jgi:hypothetical protein
MKAFTLCALLVSFAALAESPFDGTWVAKDESNVLDKKPIVVSVAKGVYENTGFVPTVKVKADGTDQPVKGHAYFDTVAVKTTGEDSIEVTTKKGGKVMGTNVVTVSSDGKTATAKWTDQTGTETATGENVYERVAPAPKGAHAVSGKWRMVKTQNTSANARTITYKATADGMSFSAPTGQSYTAKFDGKEVPIAGDPGGTTVSLKKVNANTLVETDRQKGKVVEVDHWTVSPDGKTMKIDWERKDSGRKGSLTFEKQSPTS